MSLQGNIVSIEQLQNFRASKMNFWNNVVPNTNFTCNASSAAPRRVFHMSSFFLTPCELVLFFYVNKYLQASNDEQLLYTRGNSVTTRQRRVIIKVKKKSLKIFFFIKDWSDNPLSADYHVVTDCINFDFNKTDKKKQTCIFFNEPL